MHKITSSNTSTTIANMKAGSIGTLVRPPGQGVHVMKLWNGSVVSLVDGDTWSQECILGVQILAEGTILTIEVHNGN